MAGGAGDNAASAVGMGAVDAGQGFLSLGTSGALRRDPQLPAQCRQRHARVLPRRARPLAPDERGAASAASSCRWVTDLLGAANAGVVAGKAAELSSADRAAAPLFLPYLGGERTPHNNANVRGSFHGLSFDTDAARLGYAVIEGA